MNFFSKAAAFVEKHADKVEAAIDALDGDSDNEQQQQQSRAIGGPDGASAVDGDAPDGHRDFAQQSQQAIPALVRMFSGCRDSQTSADVGNVASFGLPSGAGPGGAGGACTNSMMKTLMGANAQSGLSWLELLDAMRNVLKTKGYTQVPELSTSRQMNLDEEFSLFNKEKSTGKCRALLIGINYVGHAQGELRGCHNDVKIMREYLESQGFIKSGADVRVLMDDGETALSPTYDNIVDGFRWLTEGAAEGDALFMHYSGHGGSVRDTSGDEKDGMDETLIPLDFQTNGQIKDDLILAELVLDLPRGCQLTAVIDACHSGTVLDLPYVFIADDATMEGVEDGPHQMQENTGFDFSQLMAMGKMVMQMHAQGKSKQEIGKAVGMQLYKSGAFKNISLSQGMGALNMLSSMAGK